MGIYNNPLAARLKAKHIKALQVNAGNSDEYNYFWIKRVKLKTKTCC